MAPPAVHRSAPELARGRKVIRGDATLLGEMAGPCQGKQGAATPDIGAVVGHVKGQITHHLHPLAVGLTPQVLPLPLEMPLEQGLLQQGYGLLLLELAQGRALMLGQGSGPVPPGLVGVDPADHHETAVILQPMALLAAPAIEGLVRTGGLIGPALGKGLPQGFGAPGHQLQGHRPTHRRWGQGLTGRCVGRLAQETIGHQGIGVEQPGVEGRPAGGAVGRAGGIGGR